MKVIFSPLNSLLKGLKSNVSVSFIFCDSLLQRASNIDSDMVHNLLYVGKC
jgi:hypothetical protein